MSNQFGALLRSFRLAAGHTQESLAEQSDLSVNAISTLERGERQHPYPRTIQALATALGLTDAERTTLIEAAAGNLSLAPDVSRRTTGIPPITSATYGRDRQVADVTALLNSPYVRLLTLTGPGGVGKTRLSQQVGVTFAEQLPDGALFVPLASIADHRLVASAIVQAISPQADGATTPESLLQNRSMLLVLDNFEQVTGAATVVAALLRSCPNLLILVTSRRPLHIDGEHEYPVPPLEVPRLNGAVSVAELAAVPSVAVFMQRAKAVRPDFALVPANATDITAICRQLDGLPLALELAASRVKMLSPQAILANYHHRLELLTGGGPDRPARLQTMRGAIDWSFALLTTEEQAVFRRMSVFAGAAPLEAIEFVASLDGSDGLIHSSMLDILSALVDHSLVIREENADGDVSLRMLEVIREFASEQLHAAGEAEIAQDAHARWYLAFAEAARHDLEGPHRRNAHSRLRAQVSNLRAAAAWLRDRDDRTRAYRLTTDLARFWINTGSLDEGWDWIQRTRNLGPPDDPDLDYDTLYWGSITLLLQAKPVEAEQLIRVGLALARRTGNQLNIGRSLAHLADIIGKDDPETARTLLADAREIFREAGDPFREAIVLRLLGQIATHEGDYATALAYQTQALGMWQELGHLWGIPITLRALAEIALAQGDLASARDYFQESLDRWYELGERLHISDCCTGLAQLAFTAGMVDEAVLVLGAQARMDEEMGYGQPGPGYHALVEDARAAMPAERFQMLWDEGRNMSLDAALEPILMVPLTDRSIPAGTESGQDHG